jgi:catechol 2,3-dioxygenase-like lactoylglutathione lyase family enzyme
MDGSKPDAAKPKGPAKLMSFAHVSVPCRDLAEGKEFYGAVLGGELRVDQPTFASFRLGGVDVGIGTEGCSWIGRSAEYPHFAFFVGPDELLHMKEWLEACGVPTSNLWTRRGIEALMFFRDPSGNVIELYCEEGFKGADALPKGPPRGHGTAVDIDRLRYDRWSRPSQAK